MAGLFFGISPQASYTLLAFGANRVIRVSYRNPEYLKQIESKGTVVKPGENARESVQLKVIEVKIRKVLVANRGEIAVRIIRALREAAFRASQSTPMPIALHSTSEWRMRRPISDRLLRPKAISVSTSFLRLRERHGADAIHPGYGFLSENADFADACAAAGLIFIGPSGDSIRRVGSKTSARELAVASGVPVLPGTTRGVGTYDEAAAIAQRIGYPVMLKAAAGGGGKGMRRVDSAGDSPGALRDASSEAERAFGNGEVYVEKLIDKPRHIEIQVTRRSLRKPDPPRRT